MLLLKRKRKNNKGFTLTELIIVIAILGILATIAGPSVFGYIKQSQVRADQTSAKTIENIIKMTIASDITGTIIDNATGDLKVVPLGAGMALAGFKTLIIEKLSGTVIPSPKETGHDFYVFKTGASEYIVFSWNSTIPEGLVILQKDYPLVPALPVPDTNCIKLN